MNPNDTDGHQVGNGLGVEQPNTFAPNTGAIPNTVASEAFSAPQQNTFTPNTGDAFNAPQAPIISSTPDPEDKKENSITRAFGGRSRASKIAAEAAPSQFAAQPSPLRQNTPDFFQQGMQRQDLAFNAAAEKKAKSKKGLLIGGIVGGVVLLAVATVAIVSIISSNAKPYPDGMPIADAQELLSDDNIEAISNLEEAFKSMSQTAMYINPTTVTTNYDTAIKTIQDEIDIYEDIYNELTKYEAIQYSQESSQYFAEVKEKMSVMLPIYKNVFERYKLVLEAVSGKTDFDAISSLPGYDKKIQQDLSALSQYVTLNTTYQKMNCSIEERTTPGTQCYITKHKLIEIEDSANGASKVDFRKMILAEDSEIITSGENIVRPVLNNIKFVAKDDDKE